MKALINLCPENLLIASVVSKLLGIKKINHFAIHAHNITITYQRLLIHKRKDDKIKNSRVVFVC